MSNVGEINEKNEKNEKKIKISEILNNKSNVNFIEIIANFVNIFGDDLGIKDFKLTSLGLIILLREKLNRIGNLIADEKISKEEFEQIDKPLRALDEELAKFLILNEKI